MDYLWAWFVYFVKVVNNTKTIIQEINERVVILVLIIDGPIAQFVVKLPDLPRVAGSNTDTEQLSPANI